MLQDAWELYTAAFYDVSPYMLPALHRLGVRYAVPTALLLRAAEERQLTVPALEWLIHTRVDVQWMEVLRGLWGPLCICMPVSTLRWLEFRLYRVGLLPK